MWLETCVLIIVLKNGKSAEAAVKAIKNGKWISKTLWEGFSSNLGGSTTSFVCGLIF